MKNVLVIGIFALAGCAAPSPSETSVGLANPASVYCAEQKGKLEIRRGPDGETGYCHLPDGRVVEEWEFYRSRKKDGGT